jgi:hypothetical protein
LSKCVISGSAKESDLGNDEITERINHTRWFGADGTNWALIGQDLGVSEPGAVIDSDVHVVEADFLGRFAVVGAALRRVGPPASTVRDLDVHVDHVSRGVAFVATIGRSGGANPFPCDRIQVPQPGHAGSGQNPGDRPGAGAAAYGQIGWPLAVLHTQGQDLGNHFRRGQAGITVEHEDLLVVGCVW